MPYMMTKRNLLRSAMFTVSNCSKKGKMPWYLTEPISPPVEQQLGLNAVDQLFAAPPSLYTMPDSFTHHRPPLVNLLHRVFQRWGQPEQWAALITVSWPCGTINVFLLQHCSYTSHSLWLMCCAGSASGRQHAVSCQAMTAQYEA